MNRLTVALLTIVAALALVVAVPGLAQHRSPEPIAADEDSRDRRRADRLDDFAARLAAELDLPVDRVAEALGNVRAELREEWEAERLARLRQRLDRAVDDGDLTREQADAVMEAAESGVLPGIMRGGWRDGRLKRLREMP